MEQNWLEKDFPQRKKEKENTKKCPTCGKYMDYENIGYMRYGFVCNSRGCTNMSNRE